MLFNASVNFSVSSLCLSLISLLYQRSATHIAIGKPTFEIAKEVITGKWGNGNSRKTALIKAGYDYKAIQSLVNEMIKG